LRIRYLALIVGLTLTALSIGAVVQSTREYLLWEAGRRDYAEDSFLERPFTFAGHTFTVEDDQPTDSTYSEIAYEGRIRLLMDGRPLGPPSRALVRPGRHDLGRYHLWFDAWHFKERASGRTTLWLTRRLQPDSAASPRFEVITLAENGAPSRRLLSTWQLGASYPLFRSTQFVRDGTSAAIPLSMLEAAIFPPILLVFPIGTFVLGLYLIRRGLREGSDRVAA
jgi:hypothetical protein